MVRKAAVVGPVSFSGLAIAPSEEDAAIKKTTALRFVYINFFVLF